MSTTADRLSGRTRLVGLIGDPVGHSLSPAMHNAALQALGIDAAYVAMPVAPGNVGDAIRGLRALGFVGTNVTIPHKLAVAELMDELTPQAATIGAVNTVKILPDGRLLGHNTDCEGAVRAVESAGAKLRGAHALILGAGGAARGVAAGCAFAGATSITIVNRTPEKAREVVEFLRSKPAIASSIAWRAEGSADFRDWASADVVFQMTSLGMGGNQEMPADPAEFNPRAFVLEGVYAPVETPFFRAAHAADLRVVDGLEMLMEQGAASFELWFGTPPDKALMKSTLHRTLQHR